MKIILFLISFTFVMTALGESTSRDFSNHSGEVKDLTEKALRDQLVVKGSIYALDRTGQYLKFQAREQRQWKFSKTGKLTSFWSFQSDRIEPIALKHQWTMDSKGRLSVVVQQYSNMEQRGRGENPRLGRLLKEKKFIVKNFEPISWQVRASSEQVVVVRLTPELEVKSSPESIGKVPLSAVNMMMADSNGFVWSPEMTFKGQYVSIKTHRGKVFLSYQPFRGAKELGVAKGNKITLEIGDKQKLYLVNSGALLPHGLQAKVYGKVRLSAKSRKGSTQITSSDQEKEFLSESH